MPEKNTKNNIAFKINRTKAVSNITNKHVVTLISVGKGINGEKKIASEGELHIELLKQLNKHHPSKNIILVAGLLKRWNFWEMISEVSDEELARRLSDIPKDLDEKSLAPLLATKFVDIATSLETKYIQTLETHLQKNNTALKDISFPFKIARWDQRENFKNCDEKPYDVNSFIEDPESLKLIEATITRFLQNKKLELDTAKERLIKVQPQLADLNFQKLVDYACLQYILEEYEYFAKLKNTEVFYNGNIPPALSPIFEDNRKNIHWRTYGFKQTKNALEEKKTPTFQLIKAKSSSYVDEINSQHHESKLNSFAEKRLKLFSFIRTAPEKKSKTDSPLEMKHPPKLIDTSSLSPRSSACMMAFFNLYSKMPPSAEKERAKQKIEEATALLRA